MTAPVGPGAPPSPRLLEVVTRTLRHEVGDLLQTVYSTVAILQGRLAGGQALEHRLLADLKARAELCRQELDAVVDLVCPVTLALAPFDLAQLAGTFVPSFARRFPELQVRFEHEGLAPICGDARRMGQVIPLLLQSACQAAQRQVVVRVAALGGEPPGPAEVECSVHHDGPGATEEQLSWLEQPFSTSRHAQFGLGLALARHIAHLHGGRAFGENLPEGGFRARIVLPAAPAS